MDAKTKQSAYISTDMARILLRYASRIGVEPDEILKVIDLDPSVIGDVEARIPVTQLNAIWEEIALRAEDQDLGLHFGEAAPDFIPPKFPNSQPLYPCLIGSVADCF